MEKKSQSKSLPALKYLNNTCSAALIIKQCFLAKFKFYFLAFFGIGTLAKSEDSERQPFSQVKCASPPLAYSEASTEEWIGIGGPLKQKSNVFPINDQYIVQHFQIDIFPTLYGLHKQTSFSIAKGELLLL